MFNTTRKQTALLWSAGGFCILLLESIALGSTLFAHDRAASAIPTDHVQAIAQAVETGSFFENLLKVYMPRRMCMFSEGTVIWLHVISDLLIMLAYYSIPFALIYFVRRRRDVAFGSVFWMFAAFILACGTTHFFGVVDIWRPYYRLDGIVKAITAAISIVTAIALWRHMPQLLAIPSATKLEAMVAERTAELTKANADRERLLQAERAARTEAERANQVKDEFLATLSHELRTPLNAILGWAQLLRRSQKDNPELDEGITIIERNARAQNRLIAELLDMSRIISGKLTVEMQPINLPTVIDAAIAAVRPSADAKGIRLERAIGNEVGAARGDAARIQQVLWNILSNSIKFTPSGGRVNVSANQNDGQAQITVSDDGQGIAADFLPHVFERFRQGDGSTTRRHGGLGLGLSIARSIVEAHGGTLTANSPGDGQGATFTIALPNGNSHRGSSSQSGDRPEHEDSNEESHPGPDGGRILQGIKVLVVDDEPDSVEYVSRLLTNCDAQVLTATSGAHAFDLLRRERPDVLISDIAMPGEDGFQFIKRIRALSADEGGNTPAAALTAFAGSDDQSRSLAAGFQSHLSKPVEPADLVTLVARLAGKTRDSDIVHGEE